MEAIYKELFLQVTNNDEIMKMIPEELRDRVLSVKCEIEKEEAKQKKIEEHKRKEIEEAENRIKLKERAESDKLLCRGKWGEKVPLNRRFALCHRIIKEYTGWDSSQKDPSKWVEVDDYCAIDLVRGFKGHYWGYYRYHDGHGKTSFYKESIKPILDAKDEKTRYYAIRSEFDFFEIDGDEKNRKFSVVDYTVDSSGKVEVVKIGELKTLAEHQKDLKNEFCKKD